MYCNSSSISIIISNLNSFIFSQIISIIENEKENLDVNLLTKIDL